MSNDIRELSLYELDEVSGGQTCNPVPGGTVCKGSGGTTMSFGDLTITVYKDGSLTTSTATYPK